MTGDGGAAPDRDLEAFVIGLGAALNAAGEPAYSVQQRLTEVARANGARAARISAFPTFLMVTMGAREPALLEITTVSSSTLRLDQLAALDRLLSDAERGAVTPRDGLQRLDEIHELGRQAQPVRAVIGYAVLTLGICLIQRPAPPDVVAAVCFGAIVGLLRPLGRLHTSVQFLMPVIAAFAVSGASALAVKHGLSHPGLPAMVASLVVFLPGAGLTTSVLELTAGQMVSGSSRLVASVVQLALLAFGILAGIELVDVPSARVLAGSSDILGAWVPWLGVLVFAVGVTVAHSTPRRSFPSLLVVLYAAWIGQVLGNALLGGYVSALVGAAVMTPVAFWVSRLPHGMPPLASFLPGFWLLVPGALGLVGLTDFATKGAAPGTQDLMATVVSIFAVAVGVLIGNILISSSVGGTRAIRAIANRPPSLLASRPKRVTKDR